MRRICPHHVIRYVLLAVALLSSTSAAQFEPLNLDLLAESDTVSSLRLDPSSDSGKSADDGVTNASELTFTGTSSEGATVRLRNAMDETVGGPVEVTNPDGSWELTVVGLPEDEYILTAVATDLAGNSTSSNEITITVDRTPPAIASVTRGSWFSIPTIRVAFDEDLESDSLGSPAVTIVDEAGNEIHPGIRVLREMLEFISSEFRPGATYFLNFPPNDLQDLAGNIIEPIENLAYTMPNDPPAIPDIDAEVDEDDSVVIDVLAGVTDPEHGEEGVDFDTLEIVTGPTRGTAEVTAEHRIRYEPQADYFGVDSLIVRVCDVDGGCSEPATVDLTINPVNDAPVLVGAAPTQSTAIVGASFSLELGPGLFVDIDDDELTLEAGVEGGGPLPGWLVFDDGSFSGTPGLEALGEIDIEVTARDAGGLTAGFVFSLSVVDGGNQYDVAVDNDSVGEGDEGATTLVVVTVTRSGNLALASTVDVTFGGTATPGLDYSAGVASGSTVTFAAGESEIEFELQVLGDTEAEVVETIEVKLTNPTTVSGGPALLGVDTAVVGIADDDAPLTVKPSMPADSQVVPGDVTSVVVANFEVSNMSASAENFLEAVTLEITVSATPIDEMIGEPLSVAGILAISLYADLNGDGVVDAGEPRLAQATERTGKSTVVLVLDEPLRLGPGETVALLVRYEFTEDSEEMAGAALGSEGGGVGLPVSLALLGVPAIFVARSRHFRASWLWRRHVGLGLLGIVLAGLLVGCGAGNPVGSLTRDVHVEIKMTGLEFAEPVEVDGLPLQGAKVTLSRPVVK